jgi:hypothetical protein
MRPFGISTATELLETEFARASIILADRIDGLVEHQRRRPSRWRLPFQRFTISAFQYLPSERPAHRRPRLPTRTAHPSAARAGKTKAA